MNWTQVTAACNLVFFFNNMIFIFYFFDHKFKPSQIMDYLYKNLLLSKIEMHSHTAQYKIIGTAAAPCG